MNDVSHIIGMGIASGLMAGGLLCFALCAWELSKKSRVLRLAISFAFSISLIAGAITLALGQSLNAFLTIVGR